MICGAVVAFACGLFLLIAGGASSQGGGLLAISVIVSLLLFVISAALFIVYFRSQVQCIPHLQHLVYHNPLNCQT